MRTLLMTTALVAAFGAAAAAQTTAPVAGGATTPAVTGGARTAGTVEASDLIGARIYAADYEGDPQEFHAGGAEWDDIGEVSDVLVTPAGDVAAVIIDVGGFLGVGERVVAVGIDEIAFIRTGEGEDDWRAVIDRSRASLEKQPEFDAEAARAENGLMRAGEAANADSMAREGWVVAKRGEYSVDDLRGATVYGPTDEEIGEISDLILSPSGEVEAGLLDVGGFLSLGERTVAIPFSQMSLLREIDGDDVRVYVASSEEQLRKMPEYKAN